MKKNAIYSSVMKIHHNTPLAKFSTFSIGGNAQNIIEIESQDDVYEATEYITEQEKPFLLIGGGSNIIFADEGLQGTLILWRNKGIQYEGDGVYTCMSGNRMMELFSTAKKNGHDFSVFSTIPGTVGGAMAGNAGLPNHEMKDIFISAEIFDMQEKIFFTADQSFFQCSYRYTNFHDDTYKNRYMIWSVTLQLPEEEKDMIAEKAKTYLKTRKEKQPWGKTGGSFFKNPKEGAAGFFLEQSGMKGVHHNGAFFSEKHANFMMNDGTASQKSIRELEEKAKEKVYKDHGVHLEREVKMLDQYGNFI